MSGVLHMVNLDLITMKPYLKSYVIIIGLAVFMAALNVGTVFISLVMTIYLIMMAGSIFSVQEKNNLDRLYSSLSIDGKTIVLGRYLFVILHGVAAIAIGYIVVTAVSLYNHTSVDTGEFLSGALVAIAVLFIVSGIQLPIYYRLGYTKARFAVMLPFFLLAFGVPMVMNIFPGIESYMLGIIAAVERDMALYAALAFLASALLFVSSYYLSLRLRRKNMQG